MMNLTSYNTLKEYVEDGRYTIVVGPRNKSLLTRIKKLYPEAIVTTSNADGIDGKKLLVDKLAADGLGLKSALLKYKIVDVVYENFTKQFVEGGNVTVNFSSKGCEEWEQALNQAMLGKPLTREDVSFDLNGKVPKLYIKGQEVGVVSMTNHYVTSCAWGEGTNVITFVYMTKDDPKQKVLSINRITGEVMNQ
ncbi:hypothetical protein A5886_002165 [Enterococcus sp. 8G7_MSG3316]|uniref:Uncharacterized protein n=1 Tax=Candidatus Enterococcus testudinis TaxID=1834191 RepID=A0A242A7S0_9ENTE|nr:hypothetical protein [Enterococcus sp. 8G7_MSG3316]OTN77085.1 hypothetical protein A5886_002165 [Enterococcus sp. 8G7_MSG3316]